MEVMLRISVFQPEITPKRSQNSPAPSYFAKTKKKLAYFSHKLWSYEIFFSPFQMARTQKNKATALHLGILKARLAKLRRELITPKGGGAATGEGELSNTYLLHR